MSMDDALRAIQIFSQDMDAFTTAMANAAAELEREHDSLLAVWHDRFSEEYRNQWQAFDGNLERYLGTDAHWYRGFLEERLVLIGRYLNG